MIDHLLANNCLLGQVKLALLRVLMAIWLVMVSSTTFGSLISVNTLYIGLKAPSPSLL